ncbi:MAG: hypothetical protein LBU79_08985 [Planctomycetota bacterium]|jgi:hypothetical protein|nr:hypothetical protein [Planctomycetota bacterium]
MTDSEYQHLLAQISQLSLPEKTDLLLELTRQLRDDSQTPLKRSLMELEGLGRDIWEGIEAQEYVNTERASWDG